MKRDLHPLVSAQSSVLSSLLILSLLITGVIWFYSKLWNFNISNRELLTAFGFLLLSDGFYLLIHAFMRPNNHVKTECDPTKLTVVLATYNGSDIIEQTVKGASAHIPSNQIIIVSDTSTDNTVGVARSLGATVFENEINLNKALTISKVSPQIKTPYTLILDDDTYVGDAIIPTNLLDDGYDAVAFNVMPKPEPTLVNKFQRYEYRKNMYLSKALRSGSASIGNVSGAIGLYHTKDIQFQKDYHSGLFGGEDQERTTLTYLYGTGTGVVYIDSLVPTEAPHTWWQLFRQRGIKYGGGWGAAHLNILWLYLKLLVSSRAKFALKFEKAYQVFIVLTDPLRFVLFPLAILDLFGFLMVYLAYVLLECILWLWTGRRDPWWLIPLSPLYGIFNTIARFVSIPFWIHNRLVFMITKKFHLFVSKRKLILEYSIIGTGIVFLFCISLVRITILLIQ